ncbi:MAG: DUF29 domain-containing protein [Caldilineaceae bacterium]
MAQTLYNHDFYAWTQQQVALFQAEELEKLDLPNLIEEIEAMGISQRNEITSRLVVLLMHLLKLRYQARRHVNSWLNTIRTQRVDIEIVLVSSPSLRRFIPDTIAYAYPRARKRAAQETGLPLGTFPVICPWSIEEILDEDWLPPQAAELNAT